MKSFGENVIANISEGRRTVREAKGFFSGSGMGISSKGSFTDLVSE
jgi:hypothetical protein